MTEAITSGGARDAVAEGGPDAACTAPAEGGRAGGGHRLRLQGVRRSFGAVAAVRDVTLDIGPGEFVALLGPSGCGKTTTLRMIAGLTQLGGGEIWLDDQRIEAWPAYRRSMGFVFQNYALFPHLSVAENIAFGLKLRRVARAEIERRVQEALRLVRLTGLGGRRIRQLSGGQQQRVALARALVIEPKVLLLDEPFSNLDAQLRIEMRAEARELQQKLHITTIYVTHDQTDAMAMADRVVVMRDGVIEQQATPETLYERPANRFVAEFVGRANFLEGTVEAVAGTPRLRIGAHTLPIASTAPVGRRVTVMLRPHKLVCERGAGDRGLPGTVSAALYLGDHVEITVATDGGTSLVISREAGAQRLSRGDRVGVTWSPEAAIIVE